MGEGGASRMLVCSFAGGCATGGPSSPLWGARFAGERVARGVQRSETPGDAGREREARAEGRLRPVGAGGAKPQEAAQFLSVKPRPKLSTGGGLKTG